MMYGVIVVFDSGRRHCWNSVPDVEVLSTTVSALGLI